MLQASTNHGIGRPHSDARTYKNIGIDDNPHEMYGIKFDTNSENYFLRFGRMLRAIGRR